MDKQTIIDKFLEKKDLKEHELVYWKHKVSNGFRIKKFMEDFIEYYNEQCAINDVGNRRELLLAFAEYMDSENDIFVPSWAVDNYLNSK